MNTVVCPHCKKTVEISEALRHQFNEQQLAEITAKHEKELEEARKIALDESAKKIKEQFEFQVKQAKEDAQEKEGRIKELIEQITELTKELRQSKKEQEEASLEMQKKLSEEREKIKEDLEKSLTEKSNLEVAEIRKQLEDTKKALEDAQRKAAQKSQQLQGEVLELEIENLLRISFPHDEIEPIGKGITGADVRQLVKSPKGYHCGIILWEFKRTKKWDDKWLVKLKDDLRAEKANIPVIVSMELPKEAESGFGLKEGVWVCSHELIVPIATVLRKSLLDIGYQKLVSANRGEKADLLYNYITSHEFQQQIENIIEVYRDMHHQILKERTAYEKIWKIREAQVEKLLHGTANIVGSMQGYAGASMPQIKGLDLLEDGETDDA